MKISVLILLLSLTAAAQSPAPGTATPATKNSSVSKDSLAAANDQKARELINKAIQALGGQAYLTFQDMQQQGRVYSFYRGESNSVGTLFWRFWKWPDKDRVELTKQRDVIYIENGDKGYETTFKGTRPQEDKDMVEYLRQREYSLDYVLRRWLNESDVALFYEGQTVADNHEVERVTIMNKQNQAVTLDLDMQTHLPIKKTFIWREPDTRYRNEETEIYGNYHVVQGINTPYDIVRMHNGEMTRQRFLTDARYNTGIADSLFDAKVTYDPDAKKHPGN
ncbi:MAG TPA: hypothetical protein VFB76_12660 [Candidatus Angelobacter sp.]|nr:hypothetical protein [Candidatus Angelobacter sp.]